MSKNNLKKGKAFEVIVCKASSMDYPEIERLEIKLFLFSCRLSPWLDKSYLKKGFIPEMKKNFSDHNRVFFVAKDKNGKIIGFSEGSIYEEIPRFKQRKAGKLCNLYVDNKYRGRGVGESLARKVLEWFKLKKLKSFKILVSYQNRSAYALYKKLGFKDCDLVLRL